MPAERQVYLLDPQALDAETIAVTFAKTSRTAQSFREIAAELTAEKSAEFHEKWVVGYGHASVAEHAVLHIAVENVSRLAVETLESNRLASYTEKSTRYQKWSAQEFFTPPELEGHPLLAVYQDACRQLMHTYLEALPAVRAVVQAEAPRQAGESETSWERRIRSEYVDVCRFLLPAASLANVGVTINARALEHAIAKLLSSPLGEVRALGADIKRVAQAAVPTLVKYADAIPYLEHSREQLTYTAQQLGAAQPAGDWLRLVAADDAGEVRILAAGLYRFGGMPYEQALAAVQAAGLEERRWLAGQLLGGRGRFDIPLRELEYAGFTFDVLLDQGAYFEVKRHRMMTQTPQALGTRLGYCLPARMRRAGMEGPYRAAMTAAGEAYEALAAFNPEVAAYVTPNAYNRRLLLQCNLRSALHFIALRSAPNAHFSVRRVARRMAEAIQACMPALGDYIRLAPGETWQEVERTHFAETCIVE